MAGSGGLKRGSKVCFPITTIIFWSDSFVIFNIPFEENELGVGIVLQ